jgi:ABC-type uncharacterized transport system permease subunit
MYVYLKRSKQGFEIAVVGESVDTASYAGINVRKVILRTVGLSGGLAGIAGFILVSGSSHTISTSTAGGSGFTAIIVSWLAKFNVWIMAVIAFLLVFAAGIHRLVYDIRHGTLPFTKARNARRQMWEQARRKNEEDQDN